MDALWERYTPASRRLVEALFDGREPASEDLETVRTTLDVYLRGFGLDTEARQDVVQDTLVLLLSGVRRGVVDRDGNLAAYIRTIALNCFRDAGRYRARRPVIAAEALPEPMTDDGVARLLDELVSADIIQRGIEAATAADELELAAFISEWLTVAERRGATPTLREAAEELGTYPVHVSRQLARFAAYLRR